MNSISATALRRDICNIIGKVNEDCAPISIASSRGKGAALVGEDDWAAIEETLHLMGVPGMANRFSRARRKRSRIAFPKTIWSGSPCGRRFSPSKPQKMPNA